MGDHLDHLAELIRPPELPIEHDGDWSAAEVDLGTPFSSDYKRFVSRYGRGIIFNFIHVATPFPLNPKGGLKNLAREIVEGYGIVLQSHPAVVPYPLFPAPGGLLPFAQDDNGGELHWITGGDPDVWPVVVSNLSSLEFHRYEMGKVQFFSSVARREIECPLIPERLCSTLTFSRRGHYDN